MQSNPMTDTTIFNYGIIYEEDHHGIPFLICVHSLLQHSLIVTDNFRLFSDTIAVRLR